MNLVSITSDNALPSIRHQANIKTRAGLLSIGPRGSIFSEMCITIQNLSFTEMLPKISPVKWRPFCIGEMSLNRCVTTSNLRKIYVSSNTGVGGGGGGGGGGGRGVYWSYHVRNCILAMSNSHVIAARASVGPHFIDAAQIRWHIVYRLTK